MTAARPREPGVLTGRPRPGATAPEAADRTRGRTATLNQLLLAAVVFVLGVFVAIGPFAGDPLLFFLGVVIVVVVAAATVVIPWNRISYGWVALIPAVDIFAITLMQIAAPDTVLGLLWIFPTTWLAGGFRLLGLSGVFLYGSETQRLLDVLFPEGYPHWSFAAYFS